MDEISSAQNPKYRRWLSLLESKGIRKENLCLVSGEKLVDEILRQNLAAVDSILLPPKCKVSFPSGPQLVQLSTPLFQALDAVGTKRPLAVVRTPQVEKWNPQDPPSGLELILALGDPANLGAVLRSAEAFGVSRVIMTKECSSPFLPKAIKAGSLAPLRLRLARAGSIAELNLENSFALDMSGEDIQNFAWPRHLYLVIGEEGRGIPENLQVQRLRIPMQPAVESLNATVAASIALFSYSCRVGSDLS